MGSPEDCSSFLLEAARLLSGLKRPRPIRCSTRPFRAPHPQQVKWATQVRNCPVTQVAVTLRTIQQKSRGTRPGSIRYARVRRRPVYLGRRLQLTVYPFTVK